MYRISNCTKFENDSVQKLKSTILLVNDSETLLSKMLFLSFKFGSFRDLSKSIFFLSFHYYYFFEGLFSIYIIPYFPFFLLFYLTHFFKYIYYFYFLGIFNFAINNLTFDPKNIFSISQFLKKDIKQNLIYPIICTYIILCVHISTKIPLLFFITC